MAHMVGRKDDRSLEIPERLLAAHEGRGHHPGQRAGQVVEHHGAGQAGRVLARPRRVVVHPQPGRRCRPWYRFRPRGWASGNGARPSRAARAAGERRRREAIPPSDRYRRRAELRVGGDGPSDRREPAEPRGTVIARRPSGPEECAGGSGTATVRPRRWPFRGHRSASTPPENRDGARPPCPLPR